MTRPATTDDGSGPLFWWPAGPHLLPLLVATTIAVVPFLATMATPALPLGRWEYVAWLIAVVTALLSASSGLRAGRQLVPGHAASPATDSHDAAPTIAGFHARMGGWGNYVASVALLLGTALSAAVVALVMARTILPDHDLGSRLLAMAGVVGFVVARSLLREPPSRVVLVLVVLSVLSLLVGTVHVIGMAAGDEAIAPDPTATVGPAHVLETAALLVFALRPLVRMRLVLPAAPGKWRTAAPASRLWGVVATAALVLGIALTSALDAVIGPAARTGTALADAVASCEPWVGFAVGGATLVFGTVWLLVSLADARLIGGRIARANAVTDIFTPEPGRRGGLPQAGDMFVLLLVLPGVLFTPDVRSLVAFVAFCFLVLFGALHVTVILTADEAEGRSWGAVTGMALAGLLLFSIPPEVLLTGIGMISLAVTLRAIFIVWSEPLTPDIDEGPPAEQVAAPGVGSATASRRAEDAAGDLPTDDGAG